MDSGIYLITNLVNGKRYIGSSTGCKGRWYSHKSGLRRNCHDNPILQYAWNRYGETNFRFEILEKVIDPDLLLEIEQYYLDSFNPEYNVNFIADKPPHLVGKANGMFGRKHTEESKHQNRLKHIGKPSPKRGKPMSIAQKEKISRSLKGRFTGKENHFWKKAHTPEALEKNRIAHLGKNRSFESRRKQGLSNLGENNPNWKGGISKGWKQR